MNTPAMSVLGRPTKVSTRKTGNYMQFILPSEKDRKLHKSRRYIENLKKYPEMVEKLLTYNT